MSQDQEDEKGKRRFARGSLGLAIEDHAGDKRYTAAAQPRGGDDDLDDELEPDPDGDEDDDDLEDGDDGEQAEVAADGDGDGVPEVSRKIRRRRRRTRPRSKTIAMKRLTREELRIGALMYPPVEDALRPRTRMECGEEARPCPWVSCKHHLYLDVNPETGSIKINFPDLEPWDMVETCSLDIAERGGITLEEVGEIMNLTRERIRQVEVKGLAKLQALKDMNALRDYVDEGPIGKRRLPILTKSEDEEEEGEDSDSDDEDTDTDTDTTSGDEDFNVEEFASDALGE